VSKRLIISGIILMGITLVTIALHHSKTPSYAQEGEHEFKPAVLRGSAVYAEYCAACHGANGESIGSGTAFVSIRNFDEDAVQEIIRLGYDSNPDDTLRMIGYGAEAKGPLSEEQIEDLIEYMESWDDEGETPPLPYPNLERGERDYEGIGDPEHGAVIYAYSCLGCHGIDAKGRDLPNFPAFEINDNVAYVVNTGDGHGFVPAFAAENGGPLSARDVQDLNAYLQTISTEEEEEEPAGVSILIIIMGLGAIGLVGAIYMANRLTSVATNEEA
jgi:mono/diheme cytochrome c family protein